MGEAGTHQDQTPDRSALRSLYRAELRRAREAAGLTQEQLAERTRYSAGLVSMIETGRRPPSPDFTRRCDDALRTGGTLTALLPKLSEHPAWFRSFVELEAEAISIQEVEVQLIPGLLQTEDYAHALLSNSWPPKSSQEIDRRLAARVDRQQILDRDIPPLFSVVLNEAALQVPIGGDAIMRGQIRHLLDMAERPYVELQVLTYAGAAHAPMGGAFFVLDFRSGGPIAYTDSLASSQFVSDPDCVQRYAKAFEATVRWALPPEDSVNLVRTIGEL